MLKLSRQPGGQPEIFHSLQGEGATIGVATVFLRLSLCNLSCSWCDTKYTWDWENFHYKQEVVALEMEDVREIILAYNCPHLVVTGGEPLLQQTELIPLISGLKQQGYYCEVETNGTIAPLPEMERDIDQWNVSPKLSTSANRLERRLAEHFGQPVGTAAGSQRPGEFLPHSQCLLQVRHRGASRHRRGLRPSGEVPHTSPTNHPPSGRARPGGPPEPQRMGK